MPRKNGENALGIYLPKMKNRSTSSLEKFKESVIHAGGEVNISVKFLKDGVAARKYNGSAKTGKVRKAILIPKSKIQEEVIRKINKRKY